MYCTLKIFSMQNNAEMHTVQCMNVILIIYFRIFSVPTPQITDNIDVAWAPLSPNKNRVYRIGSKLTLENDYKQDILKFWNEDIPALFNKKSKKAEKKAKDEL